MVFLTVRSIIRDFFRVGPGWWLKNGHFVGSGRRGGGMGAASERCEYLADKEKAVVLTGLDRESGCVML